MPRRHFGIGTGFTELFNSQPAWYAHPGKRKTAEELAAAGIVPDPVTGEWPEEAYEIAPGILPRTLAEAYSVYSKPRAPYGMPRISPLTELQNRAHTMVATPDEMREHRSRLALDNLMNHSNRTAESSALPYLNPGTARIRPEDRQSWVESTMRGVVRPLQEEMHQNLMERVLPSIDAQLIGTGNFKSPRRHQRYMQAIRDMNRDLSRETSRALFEGEKLGEEGAQKEKGRQMRAAEIAGQISSSDLSRVIDNSKAIEGVIGEAQRRKILEAGAIESAGKSQQTQEQAALDIAHSDFERQQAAEREDAAAKVAMARGHTMPTNTTAMYPPTAASPSILSQLAGFGTGLLGMNMMRANAVPHAKGGSVRAQHNHGGRVKKMGGGSILDTIRQQMDPLNMVREKIVSAMGNAPQPSFMDMPMQPPPAPMEAPPPSPLEAGAAAATKSHAALRMEHHRQKMEEYANRLGNSEAVNPMGAFLARTGFKFMGGDNPDFGGRLGEAANAGLDDYQNALNANAQQESRAAKIHEALMETHRIEELDRQKREAEASQNASLNKYKTNSLNEEIRHNKAMEDIARGGKSGKITVPLSAEASPSSKGMSITLDKAVDKKEMDDYADDLAQTQNVLRSLDDIIEASPHAGATGPLLGKITNATTGTIFGGNEEARGNLNAVSNELNLDYGKSISPRGATKYTTEMINEIKPSERDTHKVRMAKALRMKRNAIATEKGISSMVEWRRLGIDRLDGMKAINDWMNTKPVTMKEVKSKENVKGKEKIIKKTVVDIKGDPSDFLPKNARLALKQYRQAQSEETGEGTSHSPSSSSVEQEKASLRAEIASLKAQRGR